MAAKRRVILLVMGVVLSEILTGCWNRKELNDLSVVIGMGIEMVNEEYLVTMQVVDTSQMSSNRKADRSPTLVISEQERTIYEAIRKITTKTSRKMYGAHLRLLILDEKVARKGIRDALDQILRDYEPRPDFYTVLSKKYSPREILSLVTPTEVLPAIELYRSLKLSEKVWAPTAAITIVELYQMLVKEGIEPVLTGLTIRGNSVKGSKMDNVKQPKSYAEYQFEDIGVFREDKFLGWLGESDSKAYNYIVNKVRNTVGKAACPNGSNEFVVEITKSKAKIKPEMRSGVPAVRIVLKTEGNIGELHCNVDLNKEEDFLQLQQAGKERLYQIVDQGIRHVQDDYGVDIFGFGIAFHHKFPKQWAVLKTNWNENFKKMPIDVELDYKLQKIGKTINSLENRLNRGVEEK
ncbi:Ger(x)C family spore germination protein [Paenibacillus roseipurpureus]|uniref:Ger(X)C family spore germination protein n=1 Tax=Paenibacillus roseopurpureus TaxID=2918901 RepID=A0AA96LU44_9BACL|nr:Ger(x)C family spore germination protein [Paenibacillus sp. MBLB1832]WNR46093.1 Ger(x)C family spore germination protein [Paenibacillus sp. MBLB1832]